MTRSSGRVRLKKKGKLGAADGVRSGQQSGQHCCLISRTKLILPVSSSLTLLSHLLGPLLSIPTHCLPL